VRAARPETALGAVSLHGHTESDFAPYTADETMGWELLPTTKTLRTIILRPIASAGAITGALGAIALARGLRAPPPDR
jgi:hypothetical protein